MSSVNMRKEQSKMYKGLLLQRIKKRNEEKSTGGDTSQDTDTHTGAPPPGRVPPLRPPRTPSPMAPTMSPSLLDQRPATAAVGSTKSMSPAAQLAKQLEAEKCNPLLRRMDMRSAKVGPKSTTIPALVMNSKEGIAPDSPPRCLLSENHVVKLLRGLQHVIGLAKFAVRRGKTTRDVANTTLGGTPGGCPKTGEVSQQFKVKQFELDPHLFNPTKYEKGGLFHLFRFSLETSEFTCCLTPDREHKWLISMVVPEDAISLEAMFRSGKEEAHGNEVFLVTCVWSTVEKRIVAKVLRQLSQQSDEALVIHDFIRASKSVFPGYVDYTNQEGVPEDATKFLVGEIPLPNAQDMSSFPDAFQSTIKGIGIRILRMFFYPRLLLHFQRRKRSKLVQLIAKSVPAMSLDILRKQNMFKQWPEDLLMEVLKHLSFTCANPNEIILHEGEKAGSGIFFLIRGIVSVYKKQSRQKSIGVDKTKKLVDLHAPVCFGENAFLTEESRMASVRAVSRTDLWVLNKHDFARIFQRLPKSCLGTVIAIAFEKRNSSMNISYPMTVEYFRRYAIFRRVSTEALEQLRSKCVPYAVPKHFILAKTGEMATSMFFLRNGKCAMFQQIGDSNPEEIHTKNMVSGDLIGEEPIIYNGSYTAMYRTMTTCDIWLLSAADFKSVLTNFQDQLEHIFGEAQRLRQEKLAVQKIRFRVHLEEIPIASSLVNPFVVFKDLMPKFEARVYKPLHTLASAAHFCDRLIVLTKGQIRIGNSGMFTVGECIGYSCVLPHRWSQSVISIGIVEVLELMVEDFTDFLKRHKVYAEMVRIMKILAFPRAAEEGELAKAWDLIKGYQSPIVFPISQSLTVNLHEYRFGVMSVEDGAFCKKTRSRPNSSVRTTKANDLRVHHNQGKNPELGSLLLRLRNVHIPGYVPTHTDAQRRDRYKRKGAPVEIATDWVKTMSPRGKR